MTKHTHRFRVWARRGERRHLELSLDSPTARRAAMERVARLEDDPSVDGIEVEEHVVVREDGEKVPALRGTMRWGRAGSRWRRLRDSRPAR